MATTAVAVRREIAANLQNEVDVRSIEFQIAGSVYLGATEMYLRLEASRRKVKLKVNQGSFDNPLMDIEEISPDTPPFAVILAPFFDSIVPEFEAKISELSDEDFEYLVHHFVQRWKKVIESIPATSRVVVLGLHTTFAAYPFGENKTVKILDSFNRELRNLAGSRSGTIFIDMQELIYKIGLQNAVDVRTYFRSKSPYSSSLCEELALAIMDSISIDNRVVKVIALDCDNTIWGGVLGEDGYDGIQIDPNTYSGAFYHLAQRRFKELKELGILLCLVSKNNEEDVIKVLTEHEHQVICQDDVIAHRINWEPKSTNLKSLALELNLGLDSFVFIDDSTFECAEVTSNYPEVLVLRVPENLEEYPDFLSCLKQKCLAGKPEVKKDKTNEYRERTQINVSRSESKSDEDFFKTLDVRLTVTIDLQSDVSRLAEMFSKTNQFNTTTKRRTAEEVKHLMLDGNFEVLSMRVEDRFTNHGLVALVVVQKGDNAIRVTDWLISCRVLGRGIEHGIMAYLGEFAKEKGQQRVEIDFADSRKNGQVGDFLNTFTSRSPEIAKSYVLDAESLIIQRPPWITIKS
jgi:FkbH-like protein